MTIFPIAHGFNGHASGHAERSVRPPKQIRRNRRRNHLWREQEGRCYWCGCQMMHWDDLHSDPLKRERHIVVPHKDGIRVKRPPRNLATIDHLRDRFHPERQVPANGDKRWVLACWLCNFLRGEARQKQRSIEELRERSDRHRSNSDIRPFVSIGEATANIVKRLKDAQDAAE